MLGTGVMTLLSVFDRRESHFSELPTLELNAEVEFEQPEIALGLPTSNDSSEGFRKEYHIYFENRSDDPLKVAIRYKDYNGDWTTDGFVTLKTGEKRHMAVSDQKTYFYYAENQKKWKKKKWKGDYHFPINDAASNKLKFVKQDIWECYDTKMCNTFAVFR